MTALQEYQRLETTGLWRANADAQRREVLVSFGNATLVISDSANRALTHWSLPAIEQVSTDAGTTIYAPDSDATETLEITDATMVEAIEKVRKALSRQRPKPGRLRLVGRLAIFAALAGLAVFWLPGALRDQTLAVVTQTKRAEIGATVLGHMQAQAGLRCRGADGQRALVHLHQRIFGAAAAGRIVLLKGFEGRAHLLPGGIVVIDQAILQRSDDPAVPAGFVIAAGASADVIDPLGSVLDHAGLREVMRLLTTGDLSQDALKSYAASLQTQTQVSISTQDLVAAFDAADVPATSYANAVDDKALASNDPMRDRAAAPVLSDNAWVSLQGICDT